jgi:transglutaminase-like putative cysteine protease
MSELSIGTLRKRNWLMRSVTLGVLLVYAADVLSPSARAIADEVQHENAIAQARVIDKTDFGTALAQVKEHFRVLAGHRDALKRSPSAADRKASKAALRAWRDQLTQLDSESQAQFTATARLLNDRQLPQVIRQRHADTVAKYNNEIAALRSDLEAATSARNEAVVTARAETAFRRLDAQSLGRKPQQFDPRHLPNSRLQADPTRKPRVSRKEFLAAGLMDNPRLRLASINPFDISHFPSASDPAYLAATNEVVLSPDIVAEASQLNGNPVAIYNWVRNNVQWLPTWGAIQDASHTLATRRGNAFDIASLTIALLRASGIPARYVHGTIDVPANQFRNWAGGFQDINAALDFASSGGIPITAITSTAGGINTVRMEHIWVEAAVDFVPSRGAINKSADSWIALDPSFKQLQVLTGLNAATISGVDPAQVANNFVASGTVNTSESWVSGFDPTVVQNALSQSGAAVQNYVQTNMSNPTVGAVVGGLEIETLAAPVLPATLPNTQTVVGARYATLPASLEQQITFAFGQDIDGTPLNPQTFPWPKLNSQEVILSFRPATQADQDALNALVPAGLTNSSQLPATIPAYLINVVPEIKVAGATVMTGNAVTLGSDVTFVFNAQFVSAGQQPFTYDLPAGAYLDIAVIAGSLNQKHLSDTRATLQATATALQSGTPVLSREQLLGDLFHASMLGYYAQYMATGYLMGLSQGGHQGLAAGLGSFGYEPHVDMLFGIPRNISAGGIVLNIPIVSTVAQDSDNPALSSSFLTQLGMMSSVLESAVPEQMLASTQSGNIAISAARAFVLASAAGQRIYQITPGNQASILPLIHQSSVAMDEIESALASGRTVVAHTDPVSVPGWTGAGYVILDPDTGAGAYKIAGGQNGGFLKWVDDHSVLFTILAIAIGLIDGPVFLAIGFILAVVVAVAGIATFYEESLESKCDALFYLYVGLGIALGAVGLLTGGAGFVVALALYGFIASTTVTTVSKSAVCQNTPTPPDDTGE